MNIVKTNTFSTDDEPNNANPDDERICFFCVRLNILLFKLIQLSLSQLLYTLKVNTYIQCCI